MVEIELPWFPRVLNPNVKAHWSAKYKAARKYKFDAFCLAKSKKPPKNAPVYNLTILFFPPDNRLRDEDNCIASIKSGLDGIANAYGINDNKFHLVPQRFCKPIKHGKIVIRIEGAVSS